MRKEVVNFDYLLRARVINELFAQKEDDGNGLFCVNSLVPIIVERASLYKNEILTKARCQRSAFSSVFLCD